MTVEEYFIKYPDDISYDYNKNKVIHVSTIFWNMIFFKDKEASKFPGIVERYNDMIVAFNLRPND